jgi:hypothetical protein
MDEARLKHILEVSRRNSRLNDLTGILLYSSNNVIQLLEGEKVQVTETFSKIKMDPRHSAITYWLQGI